MIKIEKTEVVEVTSDMSKQLLLKNTYHGQRPINYRDVNHYINMMELGNFPEGVSVTFAILDGIEQLMNGQHVLNAVSQRGPMKLNLCYYKCDTEHDVNVLFLSFDGHRKRGPSDAIRSFRFCDRYSLSSTKVGIISAAASLIECGFTSKASTQIGISAKSPIIRSEWFEKYVGPGSAYVSIPEFSADANKYLHRAAVAGIAILSFQANPDKAYAFWAGISENDGLRKGDPRKTLLDFLVRTKGDRRMENAIGCIRAWNAFCNSRTLEAIFINVTNKDNSIPMHGSDFKLETPKTGIVSGR